MTTFNLGLMVEMFVNNATFENSTTVIQCSNRIKFIVLETLGMCTFSVRHFMNAERSLIL